ncbi:Proteintyrosine phosphatase [Balamuthia mandrillaris]
MDHHPHHNHSPRDKGRSATPSKEQLMYKPLEEWELGLPVVDLGLHISRLKQMCTNYEGDGFDMEFMQYIEKKSESESFFGDYDGAIKPINRSKNRYSNVLPLEKTRVKLSQKDGQDGSDYINANWVDGLIPGSQRSYISTQGPLQETVEDFWRMVWETDSNVIVMLTKEVENDRIKCTRYWPLEEGNSFTFEYLKVTLVREKKMEDRLAIRTVFMYNAQTNSSREVTHFQYMDWPDHGLPESAAAFRKILHQVDRVRKPASPIVVHCSAGIGRTGTFCTVHATLEELNLNLKNSPDAVPKFNVLQTVLRMREQRVGMVQTKEQYMFCYKALLEETQKLNLKDQTAVEHML